MQTAHTPRPRTAAFTFATVAALLLSPVSLDADPTATSRLTPLASDYLRSPVATRPAVETDDTANDVIQLPPVIVAADPLPAIGTDATLGAEARARAAEARYFTGATDTLNRFTLPLFGQDRKTIALARLAEDERFERITALDTTIDAFDRADPAAADDLRELRHSAVIRPATF